jgi:hypothetical protein
LTGAEVMGVTSVPSEATESEELKKLKRSIVCVCGL